MEVLIKIHDDLVYHLDQKRDDLHDWLDSGSFGLLNKEVQNAVITKLMIERDKNAIQR